MLSEMVGGKKKKGTKMHLSSVNIELADDGGFIVRCSMEGKDSDGDNQWDNITRIFSKARSVAEFVSEKIMEYESDEDEMDDDY